MSPSLGKIGKAPANFDADENFGMEKYQIAGRVMKRLSDLGFTDPERPVVEEGQTAVFIGLQPGQYFDGRLPTIIRRLSLDQLSELLGLFSKYHAYLSFQLKVVEAQRSEAMRQKEFLWSHIRSQKKKIQDPETGKHPTDQLVSDDTRVDMRFIEANAKFEEINALFSILDAMLSVTKQDLRVISREVTIQQEKQVQKMFEHNLSGRLKRDPGELYGDAYDPTPRATSTEYAESIDAPPVDTSPAIPTRGAIHSPRIIRGKG